MKPRKVMLMIEIETDLTLRELRDLDYIAGDGKPELGPWSLRLEESAHRTEGIIHQVQANVVKS